MSWGSANFTTSDNLFVIFNLSIIFISVFQFIFFYLYFSKIKIAVTNKRVYGCAVFGKKVDLPLDSISAVGVSGLFKGIAVATSSGKIKFLLIDDNQDVYNAISALLIERQSKNTNDSKTSDAESIKQYKELLDIGAITQEEYEVKKKELLNK